MPSHSPQFLDVDLALSQIGDVDAMNGMMVMLQESLARDIPEISGYLDTGNVAAANRLLHALKGFAPIFCRQDFCDRIAEVEGMSKNPLSVSAAPAYFALRPELDGLLAEVNDYLASAGQVD